MARQEQPDYPILTDGSGSQGRLIDYKEVGPNKEGINEVRLWIWPTEEMLSKYNIPREILEEGLIVKTYPATYFRFIDRSPGYSACDLLCTVEGKASERMADADKDKRTIISLQLLLRQKNNEIAYLREQLKKQKMEFEKSIKDIANINEMFNKQQPERTETYGYPER